MSPRRPGLAVAFAFAALIAGGCSSDDDESTSTTSSVATDDTSAGSTSSTDTTTDGTSASSSSSVPTTPGGSDASCASGGLSDLTWPAAGDVAAQDIAGVTTELDRAAEAMLSRTDLTIARGEDGPSGCTFTASSGDGVAAAMTVAATAAGQLELQAVDMPPDHPPSTSLSIAGSTVLVHYGRPLGCPASTEMVVTYGDLTASGQLDDAGDLELNLPGTPQGPGTILLRSTDESGTITCVKAFAVPPGDFAAG